MNFFFSPLLDSHSASAQPSDAGLESTQIPTAYARWQEESNALDGHAPHFCIAVLRDLITHRLSEAFKKDKAGKATASTKTKTAATASPGSSTVPPPAPLASSATSQGGDTRAGTTAPGTPHPSDQPTPSSRSPRDIRTSSVDHLRSSLRQVADALAQTVAAVRTTREQLGGEGDREGSSVMEVADSETQRTEGGGELERLRPEDLSEFLRRRHTGMGENGIQSTPPMDLTSSDLEPPVTIAVTTSPGVPGEIVMTTSTTIPSFDGSRESAAATLASTDPNDPLHTFLSAYMRAPPPPDSTADAGSSSTVPSIAVVSTAATSAPVSSGLTSAAAAMTSSNSMLGNLQQLDNATAAFFTAGAPGEASSTREATSTESQDPLSVRALDLARALSLLVPSHPTPIPTATTLTSSLGMPSGPQPILAAATPPTITQATVSTGPVSSSGCTGNSAVHSPSPSDTLAPLLMSSLQMPITSVTLAPSPSTFASDGTSGGLSLSLAAMGGALGDSSSVLATAEDRTPEEQVSPSRHGGDDVSALSSSLRHFQQWQMGHPSGAPRDIPLSALEAVYGRLPQSDDQMLLLQGSTSQPTDPTHAVVESTTAMPVVSSQQTAAAITVPFLEALTSAQSSATSVPQTTVSSTSAGATPSAGVSTAAAASLTPIDPTFLEALPDSIRQEVLAQHEREQRQLRARQETTFSSSISPEFLAALPPNIQEEVSIQFLLPQVC